MKHPTLSRTLAVSTLLWLAVSPASAGAADKPPAGTMPPKPALTVTLVQPTTIDLPTRIAASGNLAAWQEMSIGAETNGGRVSSVTVNAGDRVRRGQVLLQFGDELANADLDQGNAAVAEAEAALTEASANLRRGRDLEAQGFISPQQVNQYLTAERTAQARLDAQRAGAKSRELRLRQTIVRAPDDGVISLRNATVGAVVPAGQELFRLIRNGRIEWRAEVGSRDLARIVPGQAAQLTLPGGQVISGRVRLVGPTVDAATRNGLAYVDLPDPGPARPGMFARGQFELGSSQALTVPLAATLLRDGFSYVFVVGADAKVTQTKVTVGRRIGDRVEVTAGLSASARLAATGAGFLADGDTVRVVDASITRPAP